MGQCRKKRERLRVHDLLLLAYRLLRWPTIVTSRLPSSPAACFCPSGSRPFPLDFLLWGPFGHAATQVKFKPPRSKSASQNSSPPPPPPQDFRQKKHFRKTDCFDKERTHEKTRFSVQKKHQTKRHKKHVLNDRPVEVVAHELHPVLVLIVCSRARQQDLEADLGEEGQPNGKQVLEPVHQQSMVKTCCPGRGRSRSSRAVLSQRPRR